MATVFPTDPGFPEPTRLTIVGTPTATQIDVVVPPFDQEINFSVQVSRSDGVDAISEVDFQVTLL